MGNVLGMRWRTRRFRECRTMARELVCETKLFSYVTNALQAPCRQVPLLLGGKNYSPPLPCTTPDPGQQNFS